MRFTIKVAGIPVEVESLHNYFPSLCKNYICDEEPQFKVISSNEKIDAERMLFKDHGYYSNAFLETVSIHREISEKILWKDVLLMHGSAVAVGGKAYIFSAYSGTGKSTHTRIWREVLPEKGHKITMINDDKPFIKFTENGIYVCGSPWNGSYRLDTNIMVPVGGIAFLSRSETNSIKHITPEKALPHLIIHIHRPSDAEGIRKVLKLGERMAHEIPCYELKCNMDPEAAIVSYEGMTGEILF